MPRSPTYSSAPDWLGVSSSSIGSARQMMDRCRRVNVKGRTYYEGRNRFVLQELPPTSKRQRREVDEQLRQAQRWRPSAS